MAGTPALRFLADAGVPHTVHTYEHDPAAPSFGIEAATALDLLPAQVFKTLLCNVDGQPRVAIVPVDRQLNLKAFAQAMRGKHAELMAVATAERTTGYVAGGMSPFGQKRRLPTALDESAFFFDTIYVSGGRRGVDVGLAPDDLVSVLESIVAPIAR